MTILFICTGNTCRSPFAAGLFNLLAARRGLDMSASSAGLAAGTGGRPCAAAVAAADEQGVSLSSHRASGVTEQLADSADIIVCMTDHHLAALCARYPGAADRSAAFSPPVSDPYGGDIGVYRDCYNEIAARVTELLQRLAGEDA